VVAVRDACTDSAVDVASKGDLRDLHSEMDIIRRDIIIKLGAMVIGMGVIQLAALAALAAFLTR